MLGPDTTSATVNVKTLSDPGTERNETFACVVELLAEKDESSNNDDQQSSVFIHQEGSRAVITLQDLDDGISYTYVQ